MPSKDSLVKAVSFKKEEAYMIEALKQRFQPFSFSNCMKALILKEIGGVNTSFKEPVVSLGYQETRLIEQETKQEPVTQNIINETTVQVEERVEPVIKTNETVHVKEEVEEKEVFESRVVVEDQVQTLNGYCLNADREDIDL